MSSSNLLKGIFCSVAGALFATTAWASDAHVAPMTDYAKSTVKQWISDATVIEAVKAQNAQHAGLSQTDIDNMDKDWRRSEEHTSELQSLIRISYSVLSLKQNLNLQHPPPMTSSIL